MFYSSIFPLLGLLAIFSRATAQTFTDCNPLNKTCPDNPALGMNYNFDFTQTNISKTWNTTAGTLKHGSNGGEFTINKKKESITIQSNFYLFFGVVEVHLRASVGQGIVSSIVLQSDDLDEVDWEMIGGNNTHVQTNYFGKGNITSFDRAIWHPVDKPLDLYHNYTVRWTSEKIEWYIDGKLTRTLLYENANGGYNFPQTPMNVRLGIWAGGDPDNNNKGTVEWAGGLTDFSKAPFTMYVQNVTANDYSTGSSYHWSDKTGSFQSIKSVAGNSTVAKTLTVTPEPSTTDKWNSLSSGVKIGIYCAAGSVAAALVGLISFCCIKQRRAGRREQQAYLAKLETERREAEAYQMDVKSADSLPSNATPSDFSRSNSVTGFTKSGASGFGSSGGYYTPSPAPPMPSLPPAYGMGGLKSPSAGGVNQPSAGGFNSPRAYSGNSGGFPSIANNGYFPQNYHNNGYSRQQDRF